MNQDKNSPYFIHSIVAIYKSLWNSTKSEKENKEFKKKDYANNTYKNVMLGLLMKETGLIN